MREINLTRGYKAIVDDEDYESINNYRWHANVSKGKVYARRSFVVEGRQYLVFMHHQVLGGIILDSVDHINGNGLDNTRSNLRLCTHKQNCANKNKVANCTSKFLGVHWYDKNKKWKAQIKVDGVKKYLGQFDSEESAAMAYNLEAKKCFGEYARANNVA